MPLLKSILLSGLVVSALYVIFLGLLYFGKANKPQELDEWEERLGD